LEQRLEPDRRIWITAPARAPQRRFGSGKIFAGGEEGAKSERRRRMTGRISDSIRLFSCGHVTAPFEQAAEVERAVRIAALGCPRVAGLRLLPIPAFFDEDPEVDCRGRVAQRVSFAIRVFRGGEITAVLKPKPEVEPFECGTGAVNYCACAPLHPREPFRCVLPQQ
jgi:hypothetical protein